MKSLSIQVQPDRAPDLDIEKVRKLFEEIKNNALVEHYHFDEGEDKGRYMNFTYNSNDAQSLWKTIKNKVYENQYVGGTLVKCSMAMCSSEEGWDDYILLHHFDPTVPLEEFNEL